MASVALADWQSVRLACLAEIESQCAATFAINPVPRLADGNLRGYVMLLAAHFQGFCRDLHTECIQAVAGTMAPPLQIIIQLQCEAGRDLDGANAKLETLRKDFDRFGLSLSTELRKNPANAQRITDLGHLNLWRNYAAHDKKTEPEACRPLELPKVKDWKKSCDELAAELDAIMYNRLQAVLSAPPW